jgi:hypothetical protein
VNKSLWPLSFLTLLIALLGLLTGIGAAYFWGILGGSLTIPFDVSAIGIVL